MRKDHLRPHIIDEHDQVFELWEESKRQGVIGRNERLLHVDFHADNGIPPEPVTKKISYYSSNTKGISKHLGMDNFILPAVLRGTFKYIDWLKPFPPYDREYTKHAIASMYGEGRILWKNAAHSSKAFFPDRRFYFTRACADDNVPKRNKVILDIDLDFFSCNLMPRPLTKIRFTQAQQRALKRMDPNACSTEIGIYKNYDHYPAHHLYDGVVYNGSLGWIEYAIKKFVRRVHGKYKLVTICRSQLAGFTPKEHVEFIENRLISYLKEPPQEICPPPVKGYKMFPFIFARSAEVINTFTEQRYVLTGNTAKIFSLMLRGRSVSEIFKKYPFAEVNRTLGKLKNELLIDLR